MVIAGIERSFPWPLRAVDWLLLDAMLNRRPSADGFAYKTARPGGPTAGADPAKGADWCANTARRPGRRRLIILTSIFIRLVLLPTSLLVSPGPSGAEPAPTPRYSMWNWNPLVGTIGMTFIDPAGLAGEIVSVWARTPRPYVQRLGDGSIGTVIHYCTANAAPFSTQDFSATTPNATNTSQPTALKPISYTDARCTSSDRFGICDGSACLPIPTPEYSQMRAYCSGSDTVFKGPPARCECREPNHTWVSARGTCLPVLDRVWDQPDSCGANGNVQVGNPIYPLTGVKRDEYLLGATVAGQALALVYDNRQQLMKAGTELTQALVAPPSFGSLWYSTLHKRLAVQSQRGGSWGAPDSSVVVHRGGGVLETFVTSGGPDYTSAAGGSNVLKFSTTASNWRLSDRSALKQEVYLESGLLSQIAVVQGGFLRVRWSDSATPPTVAPVQGLLTEVEDHVGRVILFSYEFDLATGGYRVRSLTLPNGSLIVFGYGAGGMLTRIEWPGGEVKQFAYERADLPWALTGAVNELGRRHSNFGYDSVGRAVSTELAGSTQRFATSYIRAPSWTVTETYVLGVDVVWRDHRWQSPEGTFVVDPLGNPISMQASSGTGMPRLSSRSQPAGSGCDASTSSAVYDERNNVLMRDDFNGNRSCMAYDAANRETVRLSGLIGGTAGSACASAVASVGALPPGARKLTSVWHPQWSLRTKRAEPGRITTSVYNGQPDPFAGGAVASCAPASARLPDNSPIAVLCREVEQATTDPDGGLGLSSSLQAGVPAREQRWTYNEHGQVLTHDGPRTDVSDITLNEYYADTTFAGADPYAVGHTRSDLRQTTSPAGHVTRHTLYNKLGQLLEMVDPNGIVTSHTYDLRQRLTSTTVGGQTTTFAYWPTGLIRRITQPDGSWVHYEHDDAHRLIKVSDNLGNSVSYTLDNLGNQVAEDVRDPANVLRRQLTRSIDALGRVQLVTGRE